MPEIGTCFLGVKGNKKIRFYRSLRSRTRVICSVTSLIILFGMGIFTRFHPKTVSGNAAATRPPVRHVATTFASNSEMENRLRGALWGFLAGDALASPTHWFYGGRRQIISEYGHPINDYTKPNQRLAGSILNKSDLNGGGRSKFGGGRKKRNNQKTIIGDVINHGKQGLWSPSQSNHYHATLQKGENTLEVSIARVLMKSIVANNGSFDADHFRQAYIDFMTTPGSHNDTYASTCHRMFFANFIFGELPPKDCPDNDQHNVDTMDGLVLPTIVALAYSCGSPVTSLEQQKEVLVKVAAECAAVTRRSPVLEGVAGLWSLVVRSAIQDDHENFDKSFNEFSQRTIRRLPNPRVKDSDTMSACYLSSSLPGLVDMAAKYNHEDSVWDGLVANANVGGENVHRGSVLGAILGARAGFDHLPSKLVKGLVPVSELETEIDDFVRAVLSQQSPLPSKALTE